MYDERSGRVVPNMKVLEDYKCPRRERWIVMDEVGRTMYIHQPERKFYGR